MAEDKRKCSTCGKPSECKSKPDHTSDAHYTYWCESCMLELVSAQREYRVAEAVAKDGAYVKLNGEMPLNAWSYITDIIVEPKDVIVVDSIGY